MTGPRPTTRRRYLAGGAALGLAALAGCSEAGPGEEEGDEEGVGDQAPQEEETADEEAAQEGEQLENNESTEGQDPDDANQSDGQGNESEGNQSEAQGNESEEQGFVEDIDYENPDGEVSFVQPGDGDQVSSPVAIEAEAENFELRPAEEEESEQGVGHLHVIVDHGCLEPEYTIPQEEGYHHLSEGETETEIDLEPGEHDLCLQASDDMHLAYDLTDEITIEVTDEGGGNETAENGTGGGNETDGGNESSE